MKLKEKCNKDMQSIHATFIVVLFVIKLFHQLL